MADKVKPDVPKLVTNPLLKVAGNEFLSHNLSSSSFLFSAPDPDTSPSSGSGSLKPVDLNSGVLSTSSVPPSGPLFYTPLASNSPNPPPPIPQNPSNFESIFPLPNNPPLPHPAVNTTLESSNALTYTIPLSSVPSSNPNPGPPLYPTLPSPNISLLDPTSGSSNSGQCANSQPTPNVLNPSLSDDNELSQYFHNLNLASNLTSSSFIPPQVSSSSTSNELSQPPTSPKPPTSFPPPLAISPLGSGNSYRLGNLKKKAYAQVPGLATVASSCTPPLSNTPVQPVMPVSDATDGIFSPSSPSQGASINSDRTNPASMSDFGQSTSTPSANMSQDNRPVYRPVYHHWFFKIKIEGKVLWHPFSMADSLALESAFTSSELSVNTKIPTDGGRYDVDILRRERKAVFWKEDPHQVRRCSWFSKGPIDSRQIPYEESIASQLEDEYRKAVITNTWPRKLKLPDEDEIVLHSPTAILHHSKNFSYADISSWDSNASAQLKPKLVKRGLDEFNIAEGEPEKVDHLLFLVHGIGSFCDLKFRPVVEVVDDFRNMSLQLTQSHFRCAIEQGTVNRIEVLPISWHDALHSQETGIDRRLKSITLSSIPKFRHFTNDTILDVLFYTSPVFCETIVQAVGSELNRLHNLYLSRNPHFTGGVSVGGHSLGSLILFDMLCNQLPVGRSLSPAKETSEDSANKTSENKEVNLGCLKTDDVVINKDVSYVTIGRAGTGQPYMTYPQLNFQPVHFFGLGSPIGMFITVRGISTLGENFKFPTCPHFFNIFHPFDPVAYRIEPLIVQDMESVRPVLIPHHKGRKRMHLELRDTVAHVGAALKSKLMDSIQTTWNTVYQLAGFNRPDNSIIEQQVSQVFEDELQQRRNSNCQMQYDIVDDNENIKVGELNGGRRIDFVLQEAPLESVNEYFFAMSSHVCYWESEDTMLLVLKEIYSSLGVCADNQVPQHMMPFDVSAAELSETDSSARYSNVGVMGDHLVNADTVSPFPGS